MREARWQTVMDDQLDMLRFWRSEEGRLTGEAFGRSMERVEREEGQPQSPKFTGRLRELQVRVLEHADPFYVDPELMELVLVAAATFQPEPLQATDLPTMAAFVVLPAPLQMQDRHGKWLSFRALSWAPMVFTDPTGDGSDEGRDGVLLSMYSHVDDDDDLMLSEDERYGGREWRDKLRAMMGTPYSLTHITPWIYGTEVPTGAKAMATGSFWQPVQSFLRLSMQTVTTHERMHTPRPTTKRWKRAKMPEDRYLTVVRLRRPRGHRSDEPGDVEWAHRWIVSGHWRNQWFPSLKSHRQVWIGSYVKGPEDKPLLVRRGRAFEFVR